MTEFQSNTPLSACAFSVTDTETANTPEGRAKLVEIAVVKVLPGFRIDPPGAFQTLINPKIPIDPFSSAIHGITDNMVASAPSEEEAVKSFAKFIEGTVFVAHNVPFDYGLLSAAMKTYGVVSPVIYLLDTAVISRKVYPNLTDHTLDTLMGTLGLSSPRSSRHRALYDADVTALLLVDLLMRLSDMKVSALGDVYAFLKGVY
jgi:DNA polymerase-3 subunit epsilon